jgi:hypothetical protein
MNDIVKCLNFQIKRSAFRLAAEGVAYVEGFQDAYDGHQFCDPVADQNLKDLISANGEERTQVLSIQWLHIHQIRWGQG